MSIARWRSATTVAATAGALAVSGASAAAAVQRWSQSSAARADLIAVAPPPQAVNPCSELIADGGHCYSPQVLRHAYGVTPLLGRGVDGRGVTVVLPEQSIAASVPHKFLSHDGTFLRQSLHSYDARFGLATPRLRFDTTLAQGVLANYANYEEVEDVEMVHAMAPGAAIVVELVAGNLARLLPEVISEGSKDGKVMSFSYGIDENATKPQLGKIQAALARADARGVSVFASAGDELDMAPSGVRGVDMPASDPLVTAVGGTTLRVHLSNHTYAGETFWNQQQGHEQTPPTGGGGGFSDIFARPSYQAGVPGIATQRGVSDVAFSASDLDAVEIVFYTEGEACAKHYSIKNVGTPAAAKLHCVQLNAQGGTSEGAPAWAGIAALADQYAHRPLGLLNPIIYHIGESSDYSLAFHDITTGNNTAAYNGKTIPGYSATAGWDPVTGWGSPNAQSLVPLLAQGG
jgi:subtilase family serine protease